MSRRFNLDPRAPPTARPPPPPAAGTPPAGSPAPMTLPASATVSSEPSGAPARRRRTAYLVAAIVAVLVLGGGAAIYAAAELTYPNKYVLEDEEIPSGMSNARLSPAELGDAGLEKNPGMMDQEQFQDEFSGGPEPEKVHAQILEGAGGSAVILAMRFADEEEARSFGTAQGRGLCSFFDAAVLRDGDVVMLVLPEDLSPSAVGSVARALKAKVSGLEQACGPR